MYAFNINKTRKKHLKKAKVKREEEKGKGEEMIREKKSFISYLRGLYKKEKDPDLKGLIRELKKRTLGFYTRPDGKKSLVLVHPRIWRKNKLPSREWPDLFTAWNDDDDDRYEILLLWVEGLGMNPEDITEALYEFLTDDEEEEGEGTPYIQ